jgi:hypothetical protein
MALDVWGGPRLLEPTAITILTSQHHGSNGYSSTEGPPTADVISDVIYSTSILER